MTDHTRLSARRILDEALLEADYQASVTELATRAGWRWWHDNDPRRNRAGLPDLILVRGDTLLLWELKREGRSPTRAQREWLAALAAVRRVEARIVRPRDWDRVEAILTGRLLVPAAGDRSVPESPTISKRTTQQTEAGAW